MKEYRQLEVGEEIKNGDIFDNGKERLLISNVHTDNLVMNGYQLFYRKNKPKKNVQRRIDTTFELRAILHYCGSDISVKSQDFIIKQFKNILYNNYRRKKRS